MNSFRRSWNLRGRLTSWSRVIQVDDVVPPAGNLHLWELSRRTNYTRELEIGWLTFRTFFPFTGTVTSFTPLVICGRVDRSHFRVQLKGIGRLCSGDSSPRLGAVQTELDKYIAPDGVQTLSRGGVLIGVTSPRSFRLGQTIYHGSKRWLLRST